MTRRPRSEERAILSGHVPTEAEDRIIAELQRQYPSWEITRTEQGQVRAVHRTEQPNPRLARAGIWTQLSEYDVERLAHRLFVQTALRGEAHALPPDDEE